MANKLSPAPDRKALQIEPKLQQFRVSVKTATISRDEEWARSVPIRLEGPRGGGAGAGAP
jgi:hypothetical protein